MYLKKPLKVYKELKNQIKILMSKIVCCLLTNTDTHNINI